MSTAVRDAVYDFEPNFQNTLFGSIRPSINAYNKIKSLRQPLPKHDIDKFLNWDDEKKEKLIDFLTFVAIEYTYEDLTIWLNEMEKKLGELDEFEDFYNLREQIERLKIDPQQKHGTIRDSVINLASYVDMFAMKIIRTMEMTEEDSELEELFVSGSLLRNISKLLDSFLKSDKYELLNVASILILRFGAYVKGKLPLEELMVDISETRRYIKESTLSDEEFKAIYGINNL
ncbi:MAG: hypothetical protein ACOC5C_01220 [Halobacteriota archaeon]